MILVWNWKQESKCDLELNSKKFKLMLIAFVLRDNKNLNSAKADFKCRV